MTPHRGTVNSERCLDKPTVRPLPSTVRKRHTTHTFGDAPGTNNAEGKPNG